MSETALLTKEPTALAVRTQKRYGWRPDHPDMRDYLMAVAPLKTLPLSVSLRKQMPPVYDQGQLFFECRNSWGEDWADHGYFWMPASYVTSSNLAQDFWVIEQVE